MKKVVGWAGTILVLVVGLMVLGEVGARAQTTGYNPDQPPVVVGCIVRFYDTGPEIHENSAHACTWATSVEVDTHGDLLVRSPRFGRVISITVGSDECLAKRNIFGGASNGLGQTTIRFYRDTEHVPVNGSLIAGNSCNVWLTAVYEGIIVTP